MVDFLPFNATSHPLVELEGDYNNLLDHGLEKVASYIIRKNGSYYEAVKGGTSSLAGNISFGGAGNAGAIDGSEAYAVIQACIDATGLSILKGLTNYDLSQKITLKPYSWLLSETFPHQETDNITYKGAVLVHTGTGLMIDTTSTQKNWCMGLKNLGLAGNDNTTDFITLYSPMKSTFENLFFWGGNDLTKAYVLVDAEGLGAYYNNFIDLSMRAFDGESHGWGIKLTTTGVEHPNANLISRPQIQNVVRCIDIEYGGRINIFGPGELVADLNGFGLEVGGGAVTVPAVHVYGLGLETPNGGTTGINITADSDYFAMFGGYITGYATDYVNGGTNTSFHNVSGIVLRSRGTSQITNGNTTIVVNHGLTVTPILSCINIIPGTNSTNDIGHWWITNITATQFTVNVLNDPGVSNWGFGWAIETLSPP